MKVYIEFDTNKTCFEDDLAGSLKYVLLQVSMMIPQHISAHKECAVIPEARDKLFDINGNIIGSVRTEF